MDFLLGVLVAALFFVGYLSYKAGQRTTKQPKVDDEAKEKAARMREHFQQIMNYDVPTALKRKG